MTNKLNLFSKIRLALRANRDVKLDLFRNYDVYDPTTNLEDHFVISNFISYDLSRYEQKRTALHTQTRFLFWTPMVRTHLRRYRFLPASGVIAALNAALSSTQARIHLAFAEYNKTMDILQEQTDLYTAEAAPHLVRVCFNKSIDARTDFQKLTKQLYTTAVSLLAQKIRIIRKLQARIESTRSKHFQRVRYYYERASAKDPKLPVQFFGEDRFGMITDVSTLSYEYTQELLHAQALLEQMTMEIDKLFPYETEVSH